MSEQDPVKFSTAFIVVITEENSPVIVSDLGGAVPVNHQATPREIRRAILEIAADFQTQAVVESISTLIAPPQAPTAADLVSDALSRRSSEE